MSEKLTPGRRQPHRELGASLPGSHGFFQEVCIMPHSPHPFFKAKRCTWYVEVNRVQHVLGRHPERLPLPQKGEDGRWKAPKEILDAFHAKMVELKNKPAARPKPAKKSLIAAADSVAAIVERYLDWC